MRMTAAENRVIAVRRNLPDSAPAAWLPAKPVDQIGQGEQAIGGERAAAIRDHRERIDSPGVGPARQEREQLPVLVAQVDPVLTPVLAVLDELILPAGQRVERVGHPDAPVPIARIGCS